MAELKKRKLEKRLKLKVAALDFTTKEEWNVTRLCNASFLELMAGVEHHKKKIEETLQDPFKTNG